MRREVLACKAEPSTHHIGVLEGVDAIGDCSCGFFAPEVQRHVVPPEYMGARSRVKWRQSARESTAAKTTQLTQRQKLIPSTENHNQPTTN